MTEKTNSGDTSPANVSAKWNVPTGRRTDEWSEALVLVGDSQDRAAFTRFFRHFAPLIKAFALSGSSLSAAHADELVQEVMLKVWQKAGGFNPEKAAGINLGLHDCPKLPHRYVPAVTEVRYSACL
jgi:RNA polymerase sigma-70 factor (ECF subfamily)